MDAITYLALSDVENDVGMETTIERSRILHALSDKSLLGHVSVDVAYDLLPGVHSLTFAANVTAKGDVTQLLECVKKSEQSNRISLQHICEEAGIIFHNN